MRSPWARLHGLYYLDDKVMRVSPLAELLYIRLIAYAVSMDTGGAIPGTALDVVGRGLGHKTSLRKYITELVDVALVKQVNADSWSFPIDTWKDWQEAKKSAGQSREESRPRASARAGTAAGTAAHSPEQNRTEQNRTEVESRDVQIPSSPLPSPEPADREKLTAVLDGLAHSWNGQRWEEHQ
jgi:hypothetical protein